MTTQQTTRLVIVGGVAAGATAAARARRVDANADITLVEKGPHISYANCGLPYFLSGDIVDRDALLLQSPEGFEARYRVRVRTQTEVVLIDRAGHSVRLRDARGVETTLPYDRLILAQGGNPLMPQVPGASMAHVFSLWTLADMDRLQARLVNEKPAAAVVVGGGFVGLELAEAFSKRGLRVSVVELQPTVMPMLDAEFGRAVARELTRHGIDVVTGVGVSHVLDGPRRVRLSDGRELPAELVVVSVGVRPELTLARHAGLELGATGALRVDDRLQTSDPDIFAAGDMVEVHHKVSGRQVRLPLAGPANRQGRVAATNALGGSMRYAGALGTSVVKVMDIVAASTGLTERTAREVNGHVGVVVMQKAQHAGYYPGAQEMRLKLVYDRQNALLLGAQAIGPDGVDKRIDVLATALHGQMTLHDLAELDLAYAPPFSSANDPVNMAAFVGLNDVSGYSPLATATELREAMRRDPRLMVLDVRTPSEFSSSHLMGAVNIPVDALGLRMGEVPRDRPIWVHCRSGFRAHLAVRTLLQAGVVDVRNVTGGWVSMRDEPGLTWVER
jgi:NADPH-dependent 2,4-dienoyl-CoA reductase/sulfur reductase-like enzyme/rhodanese-related sulfurtransferase